MRIHVPIWHLPSVKFYLSKAPGERLKHERTTQTSTSLENEELQTENHQWVIALNYSFKSGVRLNYDSFHNLFCWRLTTTVLFGPVVIHLVFFFFFCLRPIAIKPSVWFHYSFMINLVDERGFVGIALVSKMSAVCHSWLFLLVLLFGYVLCFWVFQDITITRTIFSTQRYFVPENMFVWLTL